MLQSNVLTEQKKTLIINKYLESIANRKVSAQQKTASSGLTIRIGSSTFSFDAQQNKQISSRQVLNR